MAADFLNGEAGPEQALTSVTCLEKTHHGAGVLAAGEQPSVGVLVVEEVGDDDDSQGRLLSLAVMPSSCAATRTVKDFLLGGAPPPQTNSTKIFIWFPYWKTWDITTENQISADSGILKLSRIRQY
jgi:hypothetical protein